MTQGIGSPWRRLSPERLRLVLIVASAASAAGIVWLSVNGAALKRVPVSPDGVVSLELAGTAKAASDIVRAWGDRSLLDVARTNVWADFAFLLAYPIALSAWCAAVARAVAAGPRWATTTAVALSWLVLAAIPLDAVENVAMLRMLDGDVSAGWAATAAWCAAPKFALAGAALAFVVMSGAVLGLRAAARRS